MADTNNRGALPKIMVKSTTISVRPETKKLLRELGKEGESDDEILRRLMEHVFLKDLSERANRILRDEEFIPLDEL